MMKKHKRSWTVTFFTMIGVAIAVPLVSLTAEAQTAEQIRPQERDQVEQEDDPLAESIPEPPAVAAELDMNFDEALAPQPVNLRSLTDEESRLAGDGEMPIQKSTLTVQQRVRFETEVLTVLGLRATSVQEINAVAVSKVQMVSITLNGNPRVLELYPHSLRSENFRVVIEDDNGLLFDIDPPPVRTYRGSVVGDITSVVAASVIDGMVQATITGRDGSWVVQPVGKDVANAPADLHAVYRVADAITPPGVCGVEETAAAANAEGGQDPAAAFGTVAGTGGRTQIAFDCDNEYYVANGSSTERTVNDVELIMNQVALVYLSEFSQNNICYVNEGVIVRTSAADPYTTTNSSNLLCQFRNEWNNNDPISNRDIAHLMTGKDLDGNTIGVAWVGVVCNESGFSNTTNCTNTANLGYGLSQTLFSTNLVARTALTAHELGHNWNACHCNQSTCTGGSTDGDCGIMWSGSGTQQSSLQFGSRSTSAMNTHRNSRTCLSTCTGTTYVDINNASSGNGSFSNPYRSLTNGIDWVRVGGTVRIFGGDYSGFRIIRKFLNLERQDGFVDIGD